MKLYLLERNTSSIYVCVIIARSEEEAWVLLEREYNNARDKFTLKEYSISIGLKYTIFE
jgi:hypothetical protein